MVQTIGQLGNIAQGKVKALTGQRVNNMRRIANKHMPRPHKIMR